MCLTFTLCLEAQKPQTLWFNYKQTTKDSHIVSTLKSQNRVVHDGTIAFIHNEVDDLYIGAFTYNRTVEIYPEKKFTIYTNDSGHELIVPNSEEYIILNQGKLWNNSFKYSTRYFNEYKNP
jgi:hypothetical protein